MLARWNCGWHATLHLWPCGVWGVRGSLEGWDPWCVFLERYWIPANLIEKNTSSSNPKSWKFQKVVFIFFYLTWFKTCLETSRFFFGCYFCCSLQSDIRRPELRIHEAYRRQWCMGDWYLEAVWKPRSLEPSKLMIVDARSEKIQEMGS